MKDEAVEHYFDSTSWSPSCDSRWRLEVSIEISTRALSNKDDALRSRLHSLQANSEDIHWDSPRFPFSDPFT
jgi:hypothetical protein